jgi:hypothetical protein
MWQCLKCHEEIEGTFDTCWACGTSRDGVENPLFKPVVDQPELPDGLSSSATVRGVNAGAGVSVLMAFLHPFVMLLLSYLANPAGIGLSAFRPVFIFAICWAPFAAIGGGIAGAIGAQKHTTRWALVAGVLSCILFHFFFLVILTNAFRHWPSVIVLFSLSIAALTGALATSAGIVVGRKYGSEHAGNDTSST